MAQKNTTNKAVTVRILDQNFMISTDASPERVQKIADFVATNLQQVLAKSKNITPYNAAILTALNIAEKYLDGLDQRNEFREQVAEKSQRALDLLDEAAVEKSSS